VSFVRLSSKTRKDHFRADGTDNAPKNIEGILAALRYLSLEAEGAGLIELANTLEDAAMKCGRYIAENAADCERT
jgi:hypothetical protein